LSVKVAPADSYLEYKGQDAVRINGQIWMRYNAGASGIGDPGSDPNTPGKHLHGEYFQWGQKYAVASGTQEVFNAATMPNWNYTTTVNEVRLKGWFPGSEAVPEKGDEDPCPDDFRLPTKTEYSLLTKNVTFTYDGQRNSSVTNYGRIAILTSKRNKNVKMIFPAQGYITASTSQTVPGSLSSRGVDVDGKMSTYIFNGSSFIYYLFDGNTSPNYLYTAPNTSNNATVAHTVRCIAEN